MTTKQISCEINVYESKSELPQEAQMLMNKAFEARDKAYAPYSKFHVGAAILLEDGTIVLGSNQENAAYPSGLCAERVAFFHAGAVHGVKKIKMVCITASSIEKEITEPTPPCGACRQSMIEFEVKQEQEILVYFMGLSGVVYESKSISNLLPLSFDKNFL